MKLSNKGTTKFDHLCHTIFGADGNSVDYAQRGTGIVCGKCGHDLKVCYCEDRLYMVECECCDVKCLVEAANPAQACYKTMAYPVEPVEHIGDCDAVFWSHVPIDEPPIYVGNTADCDFPREAMCGMELPCCGTDGRELE